MRIVNKSKQIISRLKEHYLFKSDAELARFLQIPATTLSSWKSRDSIDTDYIYSKCVGMNAEFLQTGGGPIFKKGVQPHAAEPIGEYTLEKRKIPFYGDVSTIGGINQTIADVSTPHVHPSEWIDAGDWFPDATSAIRHYNDSMVEYPSGSILVLRRVVDRRLILWGRNYSIETTEFRVTKRLQDGGDDYVLGYSSNMSVYPDGRLIHEPIKIPKETIRNLDLVIGCVTKEFSNGDIPIIRHEK